MTFNSNDAKDNHFHVWNAELVRQCECEIGDIEAILNKELATSEESSSIQREEEEEEVPSAVSASAKPLLLQMINRIKFTLRRLNMAKGKLLKERNELQEQVKCQEDVLKEIVMERDVLQQQVHTYLQMNSSLRERLEEQRCQAAALKRQLNADLETQLKTLEKEKEKLSDLNLEKDKKINEMNLMLEETAKYFSKNETEILKLKNNEYTLISSSKGDLLMTTGYKEKINEKYTNLKEKIDVSLLSDNFRSFFLKKNLSLRKSRSEGDLSRWPLYFMKNVPSESHCPFFADGLLVPQPFKPPERMAPFTSEFFHNSKKLQQQISFPTATPNVATSPLQTAKKCTEKLIKNEFTKSPVYSQLNTLKRGLFNVTRKLEILKSQLINSGVIEDAKPLENIRNLKRKANLADETDGISEDPKSGLKNLKNILEDAKSLNAKLQNMREEKQKMINLHKREAGIQVTTKKNDKFCQASENLEPPFRQFQIAMSKLKKSMKDCEEGLNGHRISADEALDCFISALSACVLSNFKYFHELRRRTTPSLGYEINTNSLMDEGSNGSREVMSPGENGGGDNLLKKRISGDGLSCMELKIQMDRLKYEIEQRF